MKDKIPNSFGKTIKTTVSLLFVLFTVFTSCTARQILNASTDLELSKTFNANKSKTVALDSCVTFLEETKMSSEFKIAQVSPILAVFLFSFIGFSLFSNGKGKSFYSFLPIPLKDRPLYILYNKRKILD